VTFDRSYDNPVVVAFVASENGADSVNVCVSEITETAIALQLQEPNYLDGTHTSETVTYLVVGVGTWVLPDGTILEAGTLTSDQLSPEGFETVSFDAAFDSASVIVSQVQSFNGPDFVTTWQRDDDANGFQLTMQEEEALNGGAHTTETIGWAVVEEEASADTETGHVAETVDYIAFDSAGLIQAYDYDFAV